MTLAYCSSTASAAASAHVDLQIALGELEKVLDRLLDAVSGTWSLAADTDWQARAAREFHAQADVWANDAVALTGVGDTARHEARRARDHAGLLAWSCP
ncbi:hypothetical protein Q9S36_32350 [Microbacterium sp. ARD31]|jgi:hypothetical protein|uniref:hypothetical protein n=1 Tax=Microbacterium sp. ARD31 TaxID=2962576 RepID=UPI002880E1C8|nr:hypothetical protein [Microbacterium sp. ARD31]MDT0184886.1 hypothetical protein [Microbacterium sp. ARD31]